MADRDLLECCIAGDHSFSWRTGLADCRYCGEPRRFRAESAAETLRRAVDHGPDHGEADPDYPPHAGFFPPKGAVMRFAGGGSIKFGADAGDPYRGAGSVGAGTHPLDHEGPFSNLVGTTFDRATLRANIDETLAQLADLAGSRLGPREEWDQYPLRGKQWPEPEADYEALGYPETISGVGNLAGALMIADAMNLWLAECAKGGTDKENQDVIEKG